jgi:hypothetical protein
MNIVNKEEVDRFLFEHRENGCIGVKGDLIDSDGLLVNVAWRDMVTGEEVEIKYYGI